ncbi:RNA-directed DNA polymerase, eukaryota, reverse transcriptase zinc-binding domain protein [Tanacetum coccineum]
MSNRRRSKRKIKIPLKFGDTVCDLMGNKNNCGYDEVRDKIEENDSEGYGITGETIANGIEELEMMEIDVENVNTTPVRNMTVNDDNSTPNRNGSDIESNEHVKDNKKNDNKLDMEGANLKSYATTVCENVVDNKLKLIPTGVSNRREVVMFDDEFLHEGIKKWQMTLCGHFVGYRMSYAELRYNLGRMWGKYGLIDIITQNAIFLFKFRGDEGMNHVLESGPWIVNNKPLFIQKWNTRVVMDKKEPKVLPLGVKLYYVPIEAWTVNGISVIASSLGKTLIMDKTTTRMCTEGRGRVGYARVLVEVQTDKEFKDKIEICYKSSESRCSFSKFVEVKYSWKPPKCSICKVFGHYDNNRGQAQSNKNDDNGGKAHDPGRIPATHRHLNQHHHHHSTTSIIIISSPTATLSSPPLHHLHHLLSNTTPPTSITPAATPSDEPPDPPLVTVAVTTNNIPAAPPPCCCHHATSRPTLTIISISISPSQPSTTSPPPSLRPHILQV